jgi:ribulose 1,5-bisphosphate carboxylase large subunit-like protein
LHHGKGPVLPEKFVRVAQNLSFPFYQIKPAWPMASGGITPKVVPAVMKDLGTDIVIGSGGGRLDVVGFSTSTPSAIADFAAGRLGGGEGEAEA